MDILIIADNPDHVFLARLAVEEAWHGATLQVASDMAEARAALGGTGRRHHFDLLLAALDSRDANRLVKLRELPIGAAPIIALVSSTRDQELAQVANQPVDWIILKPLRAEALREALRRRPLQ